jgi:GNAT superfamily N-acetyltransferase
LSQPTIRSYQPGDEAALLRVWNDALWADPTSAVTWRAKVLLDPNFDRDGCLIAEQREEIVGFLLSLVRRAPFFGDGYEPDRSWITAFGVKADVQNHGIGSSLLAAALCRLHGLGRKIVEISPYVPNYFTPGVDVAAYAPAVDFLTRRGFEIISRPISMRAELTGFQIPEAIEKRTATLASGGVQIRPVTAHDIMPVLEFIACHFTWDWRREAAGVFNDLYNGDPRSVGMLIARRGDEILGYAQHRGERFGPFGVRLDLRSQGIGRVLLAATLREMLIKNLHAAWFLWTDEQAARLYAQCGFHEVRRFAVLQRAL